MSIDPLRTGASGSRRLAKRAGAVLTKPDRWEETGDLDAAELREIWRALLGRPLAALAAGRPVP